MATKVFDIDISGNIQPVVFEKGYEHYRVLIRSNKQPLGWISFPQESEESISAEKINQLIKKEIGSLIHQSLFHQIVIPAKNNSSAPGISVVVCTRNRAAQLSNCLIHLLALRYQTFEIIIVDNASSNDETRQMTAHLPVRYVYEEKPGLDWARNRGIAESKYDIVAFTDDDVRVDSYWLQGIGKIFQDDEVMAASGFVAPGELETPAQHLFEIGYGGMGHGFYKKYFQRERMSEKQLLWASSFGIGANMAFRKKVFAGIGNFDTAFDVGTPSHGGGDVEIFHRLVTKGHLMVYDPSMLVWHYHRRETAALKKQVFDNGRSFGCYLIDCYRKRSVSRRVIVKFFFIEWLYKWNLKNLFKRRKIIPAAYTLSELRGMLTSPFAYIQTKRNDKRLRGRGK